MRVYVDASAMVKLLSPEIESDAMLAFLSALADNDQVVSSVLLETEVRRAAQAKDVPQAQASTVLSPVDLLEAGRSIFTEAGLLPVPRLRSLDAIHLATAIRADVDVVVAYDQRMLDAADVLGLVTASPG